jgi:hypothetical protein
MVRDFPIHSVLDIFEGDGSEIPRSLAVQRAIVCTSREIGTKLPRALICEWPDTTLFTALLQLHRSCFTQALSGPKTLTIFDPYVPSVLATFYSVCRLISIVEAFFLREPLLCTRYLAFWFNVFSGAVRGRTAHGLFKIRHH